MSRFEARSQPLRGTWLIDASAGTGKTYAITSLVLRLLLGHDGQRTGVAPLGIEQLLIVTFTRAATNELRGRIRKRVQAALGRFRGEESGEADELLEQLLADSVDPVADRERLGLAAMSMDLAGIHTIHAFANRVLQGNAFESGAPFDAALHEDAPAERAELARDIWRERVYPLDPLCADLLAEEIGIDTFEDLMRRLSIRPGLRLEGPVPADWQTLCQSVTRLGDSLLRAWQAEGPELRRRLGSLHWKKNALLKCEEAFDALDGDDALPRLTAVSTLARGALAEALDGRKKNQALPASRVLDLAEELLGIGALLRNRLIRDAHEELSRRNAERRYGSGRLGYEDLLLMLDDGLESPAGERLAAAIRARYPVALVDECQDTDPLQWKVFRRIYPEGTLFFVGDPKQSIYGFRGADVFAYLAAARRAEGRLTLDVNRRSTPRLVDAINGLLTLRGDRAAFGGVDIEYRAAEHPPQSAAPVLRRNGDEAEPLQIIRVPPAEAGGAAGVNRRLAAALADHVAGMLRDARAGELLLDARPVEPADIACLVRTRTEAGLLARELAARGVPSVFASRDSVYASPVAADLYLLLLAVLEPRSDRRLRSALGCGLACRSAIELDRDLGEEPELHRWQQRFLDWREQLGRRGVHATLRSLLLSLQIPQRLLGRPGGERQLADCLHLLELLGAERQSLDSDEALATRLATLIAHPSPERDDQQLRLESDAKRLTISTIHASKGLEYPIVCLPFASAAMRGRDPFHHDPWTGQALFDLGGREESLAAARREQLAEDLRLFYVAITRARSLLVLGVSEPARGNSKSPRTLDDSALGWLLDAQGLPAGDALERLGSIPGAARVDPAPCTLPAQATAVADPQPQVFTGTIARDWRESSYTGLRRTSEERAEGVLRKPEESRAPTRSPGAAAREPSPSRHSFPAGAAWGTLLHELMELADFSRPAAEEPNAALIASLCRHQAMLRNWETVVAEFLDALRLCPIGGPEAFRLADIPEQERVSEMRFELPVERIDTAGLDALMRKYEPLARESAPLRPRTVRGILKGSIDLVVCRGGRYYLVDYKSTRLGDSAQHYTRARIEEDIRGHRYELQYTLYTVALVRLLRARLGPAFDYERHVGGAIYLYLRALGSESAADGSPAGVFECRPRAELVAGIDAMLAVPSA